jgi:hypothetical protein
MTTASALFSLSQIKHNKQAASVTIMLEGEELHLNETVRSDIKRFNIIPEEGLSYVDGKGGFKKAYGLPDGRALVVPNIDTLSFDNPEEAKAYAKIWERAVKEEKSIADKVLQSDLIAQNIEVLPLSIGESSMPVMVMPRFETLAEQGLQVRDVKNRDSSSGHSMIFGTPENFENPERLRLVMQGLVDDATLIMSHGFSFGSDSCNIAIQDTEKTPEHDRSIPLLFDELNQEIRFFLFDFSSKNTPRNDKGLPLLDVNGEPDREEITDYANHYIDRAYNALANAIRAEELKQISELKKDYPSEKSYTNQFDLWDVLDSNFSEIKQTLVENLTDRTVAVINAMSVTERLSKFTQSEQIPPLELTGQGNAQELLPESNDKKRGI